ncbi:YIPF1-like [Solea senegalensis]|uniref:Protein YIPF n=1 Tax=Solea senegalensis TaxID=28829 RepID=A0AAV6RIZ2_SOLSE|nr:YIPF1-like [Solea senegalensis]
MLFFFQLLGGHKPTSGFWTFEYYESFFNVDTVQVLDRVKGSVLPLPGRNFIKHYLRSNPDLYGPFWICVTLVFSVAISGNLSTFLSEMGNPAYHYRPQFHRVTIAAVVIFMYAWLVPIGVWGFLTWRQGSERQIGAYSFLETVCVYGYSLFIYIPTSVLWIIPFEWLRWVLIVVAMVISGSVLVLTFWPVVRDDTKLMAVATVATIVVLHALLAVGCKVGERATLSCAAFISTVFNTRLILPRFFSFRCISSRQPSTYLHQLPPHRLFKHWSLNNTDHRQEVLAGRQEMKVVWNHRQKNYVSIIIQNSDYCHCEASDMSWDVCVCVCV